MITVNVERPRNQSIAQAVERGELAYYKPKDQYMSLSALQMTNANKVSFPGSYFTFINNNISQMTSLSSLIWFSCGDPAQTFIPYALLCDHVNHCLNQRDELVCKYRVCDTRSEVACSSEQCIASELWCDLHPDCVDESDEIDCNECPHGRCPDGRCFPYHWLGDGEVDCSSCTDQGTVEEEMVASQLPDIDRCIFTCNRTKCVYEPMLNDGHVDCIGPEGPIDETLGALESAQCYTVLDPPDIPYSNWAPNCVYIKDRYGEPLGCRNMKHLEDCEDAICPEGYFKCSQSYCIPTYYVQNDEFDCPFGEDESDVELSCPGYFRCAGSGICLHPNLVCDGKNDCPHSDDELNCKVTCSEGFSCLGGAVTVDTYNKDVPLHSFRFLDPRTRYLDVSGIDVSKVFPAIPKGRFLNLVYASFVDCSIKTLDAPSATQNELRAMLWIDLSYNLIETVAVTSIFRYMPGLRTLNMSHNERLSHLHPDAFNTYSSKSSLIELDLSYTSITSINAQIFASLNNLERLSLRNTLITEIVRNTFPEHFELSELDIRGLVIENLHADMFKNVVVKDALYTDSFKLCCPQLHSEQRTVDACQAPEDAFSSCSDLISEEVLRVLLWVNGFLAIIGNIVVIVYRLVIDRKILKMAYGHFVTHLSIADLLMGFYLTIIAIADTYYRGTFIWDDVSWKNSAICKTAGFLSTLSSETSTLFIALITLDRFLVIRYPFGQVKITGRLITACCVFNWTVGFLIALVPVLPSLEHWTIYNSNGMCLGLPLTNLRQPGWQFSTAIFIFLNFFLFILIAFGQIAIYKTMSDMRMNEGALTNASRRRQQDLTVAKHLSLIAITDFMCWFPVGVMGLLALDGYEIGIEAYAWSAVLVLPVNSALNPLLYTIPAVAQRWKQYREETSAHTKTID